MAEPNVGYEDDEGGENYMYATTGGQTSDYLTAVSETGEQYVLVAGGSASVDTEAGGYQMTGDEFFQAVGLSQGTSPEQMDTSYGQAATIVVTPQGGGAGVGTVRGQSSSTVQTVQQSDGTVTIVVSQGKTGGTATIGKVTTKSNPVGITSTQQMSQQIVILPSTSDTASTTGAGVGGLSKRVGGNKTAVGSVRFVNTEQMSSLPVQKITVPVKSSVVGVTSKQPTSDDTSSANTKRAVKMSNTSAAVGKSVVMTPGVAGGAKKQSATTPQVVVGGKKTGQKSTTKGTSTTEEEDEDEELEEGEISVKGGQHRVGGGTGKSPVKKDKKGGAGVVAGGKDTTTTSVVEETRKSHRRSTMSTKLAEWGLLPSSSAAYQSEESDGAESDDVPIIKSVTRTYIKKTPASQATSSSAAAASPEKERSAVVAGPATAGGSAAVASEKRQTIVTPLAASSSSKVLPRVTTVKKTNESTKQMTRQVEMQNKSLMCKPIMMTKATSCNPIRMSKSTQTEEDYSTKGKVFVPVPVPVAVPTPMGLYNVPTPVPLPIPVPIPIPCFIPTTRTSVAAIIKQLQELHDSMPSDPFEADMLKMAEMVAQAEQEEPNVPVTHTTQVKLDGMLLTLAPPVVPQGGGGGGGGDMSVDMLEMALRLASDEQGLEIDTATGHQHHVSSSSATDSFILSGKRTVIDTSAGSVAKKTRLDGSASGESTPGQRVLPVVQHAPINDSAMKLKYSYGVNAWRQWVSAKNDELERSAATGGGGGGLRGGRGGAVKQFKSEILSCNSDELNFYLSIFVKELVKPTGEKYAPDSVYYLCLGIQHYLYENGRIDNIFTDIYYSRFIDSLNDLLNGFTVKLNAQGQIICRITEEHLWESRQLGAHSPSVLLNTLIYFNTKHFMLTSAESHLALSFSNIMKQWKKNSVSTDGRPARTVYLRYNSSLAGIQQQSGGTPNKGLGDVVPFEQLENVENPLRCPVKLYEFYLSKWFVVVHNL